MKRTFIYLLLPFLIFGFFSCGDNEDFSTLHTLTDDEIAEIARQDSIAEAAKNKIDADLLLNYSAEITISGTLYDGTTLPIEVDQIATLFELSEEEVLAGIAGESGAPEIKGFAIEGTTHADFGSASNTNAPWGHWWDINGDVTTWGDDAMVFCEFDYEAGSFAIGQFPGHLSDGDTIQVIEALKYNEKRAAVIITVLAKAPGQVEATIVNTIDLPVDIKPRSTYDPDSVYFDIDGALSDLGVSSIDEVSFIGVNEDGSYNQEAVTNNGFWYDMQGYVGSWGDDASVYTEYYAESPGYVMIGQFPDHLFGGENFTIKYGLMANKKIVMLNIAINVLEYEDPETPPAGDPEDVTTDITLSKAYSDDYATVTEDVKDLMRNAFKMTTYQIHQAINRGDLKLYQGAITEEDPTYTADPTGYYLAEDGTATEWAEGLVFITLNHSQTELYLAGGNHPDNGVSGNTITTTLIATCNGGSVTLNITYEIQ